MREHFLSDHAMCHLVPFLVSLTQHGTSSHIWEKVWGHIAWACATPCQPHSAWRIITHFTKVVMSHMCEHVPLPVSLTQHGASSRTMAHHYRYPGLWLVHSNILPSLCPYWLPPNSLQQTGKETTCIRWVVLWCTSVYFVSRIHMYYEVCMCTYRYYLNC